MDTGFKDDKRYETVSGIRQPHLCVLLGAVSLRLRIIFKIFVMVLKSRNCVKKLFALSTAASARKYPYSHQYLSDIRIKFFNHSFRGLDECMLENSYLRA